jgi:hypothetical protein
MALSVEDGTGDIASDAYASARGKVFPSSPAAPAEAAIRIATSWIDATYRGRFPGRRLNGREQALEWPRSGATDTNGEEVASDEVPQEIVNAVCEAAIREFAKPGTLAPDLKRGGAIKSVKAGSVQVDYMAGASAETTFKAIDQALSSLLPARSAYSVLAVRG